VLSHFVIFDIEGTLTLRAERQSARMLKITNDGLIRSGTGCFIAVPMWRLLAAVGVKWLRSRWLTTHATIQLQDYMYVYFWYFMTE